MQVQNEMERLATHEISVVGVGFSPQDRMDQIRDELNLRIPLISDPGREWYGAFEVSRGAWYKLLAPARLWSQVRLIRAGHAGHLPDEDWQQLGAGILLHGARVVRVWLSDEQERRPSVGEVIETAEADGR